MALWARLQDGNRANKIYKGYLKEKSCASLFALCFRSLQVDGSFGVSAVVTEMLMQSHDGFIRILPALPEEWHTGRFRGFCARGAFELDLSWRDKKLTELNILSKEGAVCRVELGGDVRITLNGKSVPFKKLNGRVIEFKTVKGGVYGVK